MAESEATLTEYCMGYSALRFPRAGLDADRFGLRESAVNPKRAGEESRQSKGLARGMGTFYLPPLLLSIVQV